MQQHVSAAVDMKIQTLRIEDENLKMKASELLKTRELSVETLPERVTVTEDTVSKDSFDAISNNNKKGLGNKYIRVFSY